MGEERPLSGVKVVLIDDSNTVRRSGEIFLNRAGCEVALAEDGIDGLSKVLEHQPDVIFVDVTMPRLDGYQTRALIRNHPRFKNVPIIMLTGRDTLFERARGKLAGAGPYLLKPFDSKRLIEAVTLHTREKKEADRG